VTPLVCTETVSELLRILSYEKFRLSEGEQKSLLTLYLPYAEIVKLPKKRPALTVKCRDINDEVFLHLAMKSRAAFLVTGDADLLVLRDQAPVKILTVGELREALL